MSSLDMANLSGLRLPLLSSRIMSSLNMANLSSLRLPPESLMRFKCVGKSCYTLINNPKFVAKQINASGPNFSTTVLLKRLVSKDSGRKENVLSFLDYPITDDRSVVDIDLPCFKDSLSLEIRGHSHGLVCLSDLRSDILLCNPATREFRQLPPSLLLLTEPPEEPDGYDSSTNVVGFGYDPKSKDFKVVRVVNFVEGPDYVHPTRVEVYDLSRDGWREIKTPISSHVFWAPSFEMYHKGIYYWWADEECGEEIIQTFDMSEEVFGSIPVPECFKELDGKYRTLGLWNGSIVFFFTQRSPKLRKHSRFGGLRRMSTPVGGFHGRSYWRSALFQELRSHCCL